MALRDLFVEIGVDVDDNPLKDLDSLVDDIKNAFEKLDAGGLDDIEKDVKSASREFDELSREIRNADREVDKLDNNDLNKLEKDVKKTTNGFENMKKVVAGVFATIATYVAVDRAIGFSVDAIEAAASAQALNAQFEQVFGDMQGEAQKTLDELGKQFGMLPSRLQAPYSTMTSMFKGLGYDTKEASKMAAEGVTLVADAAAFYDMSFEQANQHLNSFIKGNYEGGEAIGLFANETQMAAFASKELGKDWKKLDEAGKQLVRLEYAKAMQEAAGATGQAARESDGYENVLGNLRQAWTDFKAVLGAEILDKAVDTMKELTKTIQEMDTEQLADDFGTLSGLVIDMIVPAFNGFINAVSWTRDNLNWLIPILGGVVAGFTAFQIITFVNGLMAAYQASTFASTLATHGFNAALRANPIGMVVTLIGLLVTAGIALYQNWDTVKTKTSELWSKIRENPIGAFLTQPIQNAIDAGKWLIKNWDDIKLAAGELWTKIKESPITSFLVKPVKNAIDAFKQLKDAMANIKMPDWVGKIGSGALSLAKKLIPGHATGLGRVPYDGYIAELHKDEAVLTAEQSNALRKAGILKGDGIGPELDLSSGSSTTTYSSTSNASVNANVNIIVQGSDNPRETARSIKDQLEEFFADLNIIIPATREG